MESDLSATHDKDVTKRPAANDWSRYEQISAFGSSRLHAGNHYGTTQPPESETVLEQDAPLPDSVVQDTDPHTPIIPSKVQRPPSSNAAVPDTRVSGQRGDISRSEAHSMFHDFAEREKESLSLLTRRLGKVSVAKPLPPPSQIPQVPFPRAVPRRTSASMHLQANALPSKPLKQMQDHDASDKKSLPPLPARASRPTSIQTPVESDKPSFEGYLFTLLDPVQPGEDVSWTKTRKAKLRASSQEVFDKATSHGKKTGWTCAQQLQALDSGQQALIQRLLADKNADKGEHTVEWTLFGVQKLYEERKSAFRTSKFNYAIRVTIKRGDMAIIAENTQDKSADKRLSSEDLSKFLVTSTHENSLEREFKEHTLDGLDTRQNMGPPLPQKFRDRQHDISHLQENVTDINDELQDVKHKANVHERRKILKASLDPEHGKQPVDRDNGTLSPSIKPLLQEGSRSKFPSPAEAYTTANNDFLADLHSPTHALLASKSNYQNLLEGNHLLGISYPDSLSTGLTSKRTSHKVAAQRRRNRINDALKEMRALIPASSGARVEKFIREEFMTNGGGGDDDSQETKEKNSPRRKLRRSVNDLEISVEDTRGHEQTMPDVDIRPESFGANLQDTNTEVSGSHDWGISAAGGADGMLVGADISEACTSPHYDRQEAAPPSEPRSTQTETAQEDKTHRHDDVNVADLPVLSTIAEKVTTEEAPNAEWALVSVNSLFEHTPEDGKVNNPTGVNLDRGDLARELAQDLKLVDENSKETTQEQSTLKLQLQLEEDEVALQGRTAPQHGQDVRNIVQLDDVSDDDLLTLGEDLDLGYSNGVHSKCGHMLPESAGPMPQVSSIPLLTDAQRRAPIPVPPSLFQPTPGQPPPRGSYVPTWPSYGTADVLPENARKLMSDPKLKAAAEERVLQVWSNEQDNFLDSLSSVQSTRDDFWSNPDSCRDQPSRRGTPGTSPERGYLQRPADQHRLLYLYGERHGRRDSRPDLLLDRDPQRSVSILEDIAQYAYNVERVSHTKLTQPPELLDDITKSLLCTRELEPILAAACKDVDIGAERLEQNLRRLIQLFGEELKSEATDARELEAARAMMTPEVSSYIAWSILQHVKAASSKPDGVEARRTGPSRVSGTDAGHWQTFRKLRSLLMPATTSFRTFEEEVIWMNRNQDLNTKEVELVVNAATLHESEMALQSAKRVTALTFISSVYLPLSFSASFFSMNMSDTGKTQHEYWWLLALLFLTTVCILLAFHVSAILSDHHKIGIPPSSNSGTHSLLYNSDAYDIFRAGLLDSVHEPYEKRILLALGGEVEQSGVHLEQDSIHHVAREISWVPEQFFTYPSDTDLSCAGAAKAFVEDRLGESWNWWPLAPRIHWPRSGYCRIQWKSVCISISKSSIDV
jgi:hypothetical protein